MNFSLRSIPWFLWGIASSWWQDLLGVNSIIWSDSHSNASNISALHKEPLIGVYYYPWYDIDRHWQEGYVRELLQAPQQPYLGQYSSRDNATIERHVQWMQEYRISLMVASWWGPNSFEDVTMKDYMMTNPHFLESHLQFALFYESAGLLQRNENGHIDFNLASNRDKLISDFRYMASAKYFDHPNYFRVHNKPVVFIYLTRIWEGNYQMAIDNLRNHLKSEFAHDLYLVGDEVYWGSANRHRMGMLDAVTAYNMHGPAQYQGFPADTKFLQDVESQYLEHQQIAQSGTCWRRRIVDFIPGIMPGFNDRGVRLDANHYVIPQEMNAALEGSGTFSTFWNSLHMAYRVLQQRQQEQHILPPLIMITSWNEWHEDTNIEPTAGDSLVAPNEPFLYTQGYMFEDYSMKLLELIPRFLNEVLIR